MLSFVMGFFHSYIIHLSSDEHLGYFHSGAVVNNAAMNIRIQVFVWTYVFMSRSGIAGSYSNSIFNFLRNC